VTQPEILLLMVLTVNIW